MPIATRVRGLVRSFAAEAGLRFLMRRKGAFIVAAVTMALALGANTAVFSVVRAFLLSSLGVPDATRVVSIIPTRQMAGRGGVLFSDAYPNYELLRSTQHAFAAVTCLRTVTASWDDRGEARPLQLTSATGSFFPTMRVWPVLGRSFREDEEGPSPAPVVLISYTLWKSAFLGDSSAVGQVMRINGAPLTVIGVMPQGFAQPLPTDVWVPFDIPAFARTAITGARQFTIYGRIADGLSRGAVDREMAALTKRALDANPVDNRDFAYQALTLRQVLLNGADRTVLLVQIGAAVLLVLAVLNLASLLIAWGYDRRQELAVRLALGARGARIVRMLLLQSVVVVGVGAVIGTLLAQAGVRWFGRFDPGPALSPFMSGLRIDSTVLFMSIAIAVVAGTAAGVLPAWFSRRADLADALRTATRAVSLSRNALRWQKGMVFAQAALSVVVLAAAALIGLSFRNLANVPGGFDPAGRMVARVQLADNPYGNHGARAAFARALLDNLSRETAISGYGFSTTLPVGDQQWGARVTVQQSDGSMTPESMLLHIRRVSPSYLETMAIPVLQGRGLDVHDDSAGRQVTVISHALAMHLWPKGDAIGKRIVRAVDGPDSKGYEIVGIVGDAMDAGYNAPPGETFYVPYAQMSAPQLSIVVRARSTPAEGLAAIRHALQAADPVIAANNTAAMDALVQQANALPRLQSVVLLVFALVALGIAALGSYGVMNQLVANRQREFVLRMVFGAARGSIGGTVLLQVATLTLPGVIIGLGGVYALHGLLKPFVFGVDPQSVPLLLAVGLGIVAMSVVATLPSVLRAMRVDVRESMVAG